MTDLVEVVVGVIGKPHGVRGEATIELRTDEPERRFSVGTVLEREDSGPSLTVESMRFHNGRLLVSFAELTDRTAVEQIRGARLVAQVPADETPDAADEYYDRQLTGLRVIAADGSEVGTVVSVLHLPVQDVLEVRTPDGDRLVPFVQEVVPTVDLAAGFLALADLPGLLYDESDVG